MKKALRALGTKAGILITLLAVAAVVSGVVWAIAYDNFIAVILTISAGALLWLMLLFQLITVSTTAHIRKSNHSLESVAGKNDRNLRRIQQVVNNIVGTTGRAAPIIRDLSKLSHTIPDALEARMLSDTSHELTAASHQRGRNDAHPSLDLPSVKPRKIEPRYQQNVMVIADEFTAAAFESEWHQVRPTPDNWRTLLDTADISLLFIESAWEGNGGSWRYHLVGPSAPRLSVIELVEECRSRGIPVAFWNKEDPPHFHDFLDVAKLADYVFTTEGDLVKDYMDILGHERVQVLPFAAQVSMHNPARIGHQKRDREISFGGTYFRHKYPERRAQLEALLPAAAQFELDIFSRLHNNEEKYQFPEPFAHHVRGMLPYPKMVGAYHAYKVILNVNSVVDSKTMCARRIFEATASGAAVVSAPSRAVETYFPGGLITTAEDEETAYHRLRTLLRSSKYRDRLVHRAQREIWEKHTYKHRAAQILAATGSPVELPRTSVSVIVTTNRPDSVDYLIENILRQNYTNKQAVILTHGFKMDPKHLEILERAGIPTTTFEAPSSWSLGQNLNHLVNMASGDVIMRMDDDDWYGENYVRDSLNALYFSGADLVGKAASYIYFEEKNLTILGYEAHEHRYTDFVRGATFSASKAVFQEYRFPEVHKSEDSAVLNQLTQDGAKIYSADRFNFVVNRWQDKSRHTWTVSDDQLLGTGDVKFIGQGHEQVAV